MQEFHATLLTYSEIDHDEGRIKLTVCDRDGRSQSLTIDGGCAKAIAALVTDMNCHNTLTKVPQNYAVGHGTFEPFVLLQFDGDPSYAISAAKASELGEALIAQAERVPAETGTRH